MTGFYKAIGYLIGAVIIYFLYDFSRENGKKTKSLPKSILGGIGGVLVIVFFTNALLGTHTEECDEDPIRGTCTTVQDYEPTDKERLDNLIFWALVSGTPILGGLWEGYKKRNVVSGDEFSSMDDDTVENIIQDFGKTIETVSNDALNKYPTQKYPESLLPHPKERIKIAFKKALLLQQVSANPDKEEINTLKIGQVYLDFFVPDTEANEENSKILETKEWQNEIKKHEQKS